MGDGVTGLEVILTDAKGTAAASSGIRAAVGEGVSRGRLAAEKRKLFQCVTGRT